ncbi:MAG: PaaI family thioesterase [Gammaproteobacteria bacterium]|nr:PaaI family thioesterase [Gammaproteobacteria bacterium]
MTLLSPFEQFVNLEIDENTAERTIVSLPAQEITLNLGGTLHGGSSMTLINMAAKRALYPLVPRDQQQQIKTLDQSVRFTGTSRGEKVSACAVVIKKGKELAFVDVEVSTDAGKLVSKGLVTLRYGLEAELISERKPPTIKLEDFYPQEWHPGMMASLLAQRGFTANIGLSIKHVKDDKSIVRLDESAHVFNHAGVVDDGAIATLCDSAGAMATMAMTDQGMARGSTPSLHINYFSTLENEALVALGSGQWSYNESYMADVSIVGEKSGTLYAEAQVLFRIVM